MSNNSLLDVRKGQGRSQNSKNEEAPSEWSRRRVGWRMGGGIPSPAD